MEGQVTAMGEPGALRLGDVFCVKSSRSTVTYDTSGLTDAAMSQRRARRTLLMAQRRALVSNALLYEFLEDFIPAETCNTIWCLYENEEPVLAYEAKSRRSRSGCVRGARAALATSLKFERPLTFKHAIFASRTRKRRTHP